MQLTEIKPYSKNAKIHPKKQIEQIANSIKEFGFNQPLVIDKNNEIIVGHGRFEAAKLLGLQDVPVLQVNLAEEQAKAYRLADNKLNESEWDMKLVIDELKELNLKDFDITLTGFDRDLIIEPDEKDDVIPENVLQVAKLGDIWQLGRHRVMCGDSTKVEDVDRLMESVKANLFLTDPPYGVSYTAKNIAVNGNEAPKSQGNNVIENDELTLDDIKPVWLSSAKNAIDSCTDEAPYYWFACQGGDQMMMMMMMIGEAGWLVRHELIWKKDSMVFGRCDYHYQHEPILYGWKKKGKHNWYSDRKQTSILEYPRPKVSELHPTTKPVELMAYLLCNSTQENGLVLDLFLGSGSTLIACEKTNRICYGMELEPKYVSVIIKRYIDYVGTDENVVRLNDDVKWKDVCKI